MSSYLLYKLNHALCVFATALDLQLHISDWGQNHLKCQFSSISQSNGLSSNLNPNCQHESIGMIGFQNRVSDLKLLEFYTNRDNSIYLRKCDFQRKSICQFWNRHWIRKIETSLRVVLNPNYQSLLALRAKQDKL